MQRMQDLNLKIKTVLLRANLNVPIKNGIIQDDFRIKTILPTIEYLHRNARKTVVIAHLGRPEGKDLQYSLKPVIDYLSKLVKFKITFINDCVGPQVKTAIEHTNDGSLIILENLRFHKGEQSNDESFGKELAKLADVYINDAFGDSYKEYASVIYPPRILPSAAGFRLQQEIKSLCRLKDKPDHPFTVIIGGAKISEKMGVIVELGRETDDILVGGGVANTLLKALGHKVGSSLVQDNELDVAGLILHLYKEKIILPKDVAVAKKVEGKSFDSNTFRYCFTDDIKEGEAILDIGPKTLETFIRKGRQAQDIFWSGPLGYIEWEKTAQGSMHLLEVLADLDNYTAIGGGETALIASQMNITDKLDFISTGGGASLKFLSGKTLPGVMALK